MPKEQGFTRDERLTRKAEIDRVRKEGSAHRAGELVIMALPNGRTHSRLGMIVPRRVGDAVIRNRMKRLIRAAFRLNKGLLTVGHDFVAMPRRGWTDLRLAAIEGHFRRAFEVLCRGKEKMHHRDTENEKSL